MKVTDSFLHKEATRENQLVILSTESIRFHCWNLINYQQQENSKGVTWGHEVRFYTERSKCKAEPDRKVSPEEIRLYFSTCYYLLSPHSSSLSQRLKLASSPRSQTSCCIPTDISWGNMTLYNPQNTAWSGETLRSIQFVKGSCSVMLKPFTCRGCQLGK